MIGFSTPILDVNGIFIFKEHPTTQLHSFSRRLNRTATLDGGVDVEDLGYADVDRPVEIVVFFSVQLLDSFKYLLENYASVGLSTQLGFNIVNIRSVRHVNDTIKITCEIVS